MSRQLKAIVILNILIVILFVYFNWANWAFLNDERVGLPIISEWDPIWIHVAPRTSMIVREPNQPPDFTSVLFPNYTLMLFLLSTTINLYFLIKHQRTEKE